MTIFNIRRMSAVIAVTMSFVLTTSISEAENGEQCVEGEPDCVCDDNGECTIDTDLGGTTTVNPGTDPAGPADKPRPPSPYRTSIQVPLSGEDPAMVFEVPLAIPRLSMEVAVSAHGRPLSGDPLEFGGLLTGLHFRPFVWRAGPVFLMPGLGAGITVTRVDLAPRPEAPRANLFGVAGTTDFTAALPLLERFCLTAGVGLRVTRILEHPTFVDTVDPTEVDIHVSVGVGF